MNNQKQRFPVGAIVCTVAAVPGYKHGDKVYGKLSRGAEGIVTGHTDDGRAMFDFYGSVHTFNATDGIIELIAVPNPLAQIKWRDARIAELERQAEKRESELIKQVDCVIDLQAQLRAAQWAPLEHRETIGDERWPQTVWLVIQEHGFSFCTPYSTDHIRLPEGYALCRKVQP